MRSRLVMPGLSGCLVVFAMLMLDSGIATAAPVISGLSPNSATAGGPEFILTVNGSGFGGLLITATVQWNGAARPTTLVSSSQLRATIPASDISVPGTAQVTVRNQGAVTDETSSPASFTINQATNPVPSISSLSPVSAIAGGPSFVLTVSGANFDSNSRVRWNGSNRPTDFVNASRLTAAIPATDIATPGTATITVMTPGAGSTNALTFTITGSNLTITTSSPLPAGSVGSAYSQTLAASGGTPPYTWSVSSGSLPVGIVLNSPTGTLTGTPSAAGDSSFTIRVSAGSANSSKSFQLSIRSAASPVFTISGAPDIVEPAQQPSVGVSLTSAFPSPISGQLTLRFTSNADVAADDPSIQFASGGRVVNFSIPANTTRAFFANNATSIGFQTGTVSGTIELSLTAQSGGVTVSPNPPPSRTLALSRRAPSITRLNIASRSTAGFELAVTGFSTPRSLTEATFRFTGAQGANLETGTVTLNLATAAASWFQTPTAATVGGQFRLLIPFSVQGDLGAVQSVSVTLTNGEGTSGALSVQF